MGAVGNIVSVRCDVEGVLGKLNALLERKGYGLKLVNIFDNRVVSVKTTGLCGKCPASKRIVEHFVCKILKKKISGIERVVCL